MLVKIISTLKYNLCLNSFSQIMHYFIQSAFVHSHARLVVAFRAHDDDVRHWQAHSHPLHWFVHRHVNSLGHCSFHWVQGHSRIQFRKNMILYAATTVSLQVRQQTFVPCFILLVAHGTLYLRLDYVFKFGRWCRRRHFPTVILARTGVRRRQGSRGSRGPLVRVPTNWKNNIYQFAESSPYCRIHSIFKVHTWIKLKKTCLVNLLSAVPQHSRPR